MDSAAAPQRISRRLRLRTTYLPPSSIEEQTGESSSRQCAVSTTPASQSCIDCDPILLIRGLLPKWTDFIADEIDQHFERQVSKFPADVRCTCEEIVTRRNAQNAHLLWVFSLVVALLWNLAMYIAPYVSPWVMEARLHGVLTLEVVGRAGMFPEDCFPKVAPLWMPLFSFVVFGVCFMQLPSGASLHQEKEQETCADAPISGFLRKLLMLRYLGSMLVLFLAFAYFGKRARPWTVVRVVMISFSLFRLSLLGILHALSPEPTLYLPGELSFLGTAAADVYLLLLYAAMTIDVRRCISTFIMPTNCVPIIQADLASLSQATATHRNDATSLVGHHYAETEASTSQTGADADTIAPSSCVVDDILMDFHFGMPADGSATARQV